MFFEMMPFVSFPLVTHDEKPASLRAAGTYLRVSVIGGLFVISGMLILYKQIGSLTYYTVLTFAPYTNQRMLLIAGLFMLVGFGAIAGIYPLHTWLSEVYIAAPTPVSVLMSGILTKCGLFGIITVTVYMLRGNVTWSDILILLGSATMIWGAVCALLSSDLKKILAFSSMSQTGFILVGAGVFAGGTSVTAAAGLIIYMVNNSLTMPVLFGAAGVIYMNMHSFELDDIRGSGHGKTLLSVIFLSGALEICGIPLWNGYISYVLLHESIIEMGSPLIESLLLFAGGLTMAYIAKIYIVIFVDRRNVFAEPKTIYMDLYSRTALAITAAILPLIGILPNTIALNIINYSIKKLRAERLGMTYYFSGEMLMGAFISLLIGMAIYIVFIRRRNTKNLLPARFDLEEKFYRPLLRLLPALFNRIFDSLVCAGISVRSFCLPKSNRQRRAASGEANIPAVSTLTGKVSSGLLITCTGLCAVLACLIINQFI
jgi:hydrogenase-4 component B